MDDGTSHYRQSRWMFNKIWFKFPERVSLKTLVLRTPALAPRTPKWYVYPRLRTTDLSSIHGPRKRGRGGLGLPLDFQIISKKSCFFNFEGWKPNFTTFGSPLEKFLGKSPTAPPLEKLLPTPMPPFPLLNDLNTVQIWLPEKNAQGHQKDNYLWKFDFASSGNQ